MELQRPTVGRVVHYVSRGSADGVFAPACRAAVVTEVDANDEVGLAVLNPGGLFFDRQVAHREPTEGELVGGTWHWPEWVT
jgi:hypothetical protein